MHCRDAVMRGEGITLWFKDGKYHVCWRDNVCWMESTICDGEDNAVFQIDHAVFTG